MGEPRFDVLFTGKLLDTTDVAHVQQRLRELFKLDQAGIDHLFSGQRVSVKRDVDQATAERFRAAFHQAGALAELVPLTVAREDLIHFDDNDEGNEDEDEAAGDHGESTSSPSTQDWSLAPAGAALEELSDQGPAQNPDTSKLSLIEGQDWSLEDCAPPPLAQPLPDIDDLRLEPLADSPARQPD